MESRALGIICISFMKAVGYILAVLPFPIRFTLSRTFGVFLLLLAPRAHVVKQNLEYAYPGDENKTLRSRLLRKTYFHLVDLFLESLIMLGPWKWYLLKNTELHGKENWDAAMKSKEGAIFLSSHVGNWEYMAAGGALRGIDIMLVTKRLKPAWLFEAITQARLECGVKGTYEPQTMKDILRQLKSRGTIGVVLDQYTGPPVGIRVPFFGIPVGTHSVLAMLAKRTGASVLPVVNFRTPGGKIQIHIRPALSWITHEDPQIEVALNTAQYAKILERDIHDHPEQWLWTHRRFKGELGPLLTDEWQNFRMRS